MSFRDDMTLGEARAILRGLLEHGEDCPTCGQHAQVYRRPMTSVAARALIALWRAHRTSFGHMPTVARLHVADAAGQGGYLVLGAHWGLIEDETSVRGDQGRAGYWRVTAAGEQWLNGHSTVAKYVRLYNGQRLEFDGPQVDVVQVLGQKFDLVELLGAPPIEAGPAQLFDLRSVA